MPQLSVQGNCGAEEVPIRLTTERLNHIARRHPEMADQEGKILETITSPDYVQEGDSAP